MSKNPFNFSKTVGKKDFFNRKKETDEAIGYLRNLQNFSIIGEECIGKSSFLFHVLSRKILEEHEVDADKYVIVYINMGSLHEVTKDALNDAIVKEIRAQTCFEIESENTYDKLKVCVEKLALNGKNLIIAFDEFEAIKPILDNHFSRWLKFIFQSPNVMAIVASHRPMEDVEISESGESPLSNRFGNITLELFAKEDSTGMISEMFQKGEIELEEEEISMLADMSGGNPYFIQLLGHHYYEKKKNKNKKMSQEKFKEKMLHYSKGQFEWYWKNLRDEERDYLIGVERGYDKYNPQVEYELKKRGFLVEENGRVYLFSSLFLTFIREKIRAHEISACKELSPQKHIHLLKRVLKNKSTRFLVIFSLVSLVIIGLLYIMKTEPNNSSEDSGGWFIALLGAVIAGLVTTATDFFLSRILKEHNSRASGNRK